MGALGTGGALGIAAAAALSAWLALGDLEVPGLYYDEAIQAVPAAEFLREGGRPLQIPGAKSVWLGGGWFPVLTQPYMGALKSQLLIPVFAAFGTSVPALRATTYAWGLLGCLLAALFAGRLLGAPVAVATFALLALDPALLFVSRHDWGSFALGLVLRCGGFLVAAVGLERRSSAWLGASGLALGLGVYNKIDLAPAIAAAVGACLLCNPRAAAAIRDRASGIAAFAAGLALGAAPLAAGGLHGVAAIGDVAGALHLADELPEKLSTWRALLDGSYFHRLLLAGGSFEALPQVEGAASGLFAPALAASALFLVWRLARRRPWQRAERTLAFALAALALSFAALLLVPRAVRIHHALNVLPFPQIVVAAACVELWRLGARGTAGTASRPALRALAAAGLAAVLAGQVFVDLRTLAEIRTSGGRGRWSDALGAFARELAAEPGVTVVSLDWGFHAPLRFLAPKLESREPFWSLLGPAAMGTHLEGTPQTVYLVQDPRYRVFDLGQDLVATAARLPAGSASVRAHTDRSGGTAFLSVRIARPHRLVYRGRLEVELE